MKVLILGSGSKGNSTLLITNTKKILIIEMYNNFQKEGFNKSISYLTRIFSNQLERGESYLNVKKVIGINFMKGNYNYNNFYLINEYGFINKLNYGSIKLVFTAMTKDK